MRGVFISLPYKYWWIYLLLNFSLGWLLLLESFFFVFSFLPFAVYLTGFTFFLSALVCYRRFLCSVFFLFPYFLSSFPFALYRLVLYKQFNMIDFSIRVFFYWNELMHFLLAFFLVLIISHGVILSLIQIVNWFLQRHYPL